MNCPYPSHIPDSGGNARRPSVDRYRTLPTVASRVFGTSFPSVSAHTTGHQYRWYTCFSDAGYGYCTGAGPGYWYPYEFTAN